MKLRIFSLIALLIHPSMAEREPLVSEEVYSRIDECIHDYYHPFVRSSDEPEAVAIRKKAFEGLNDREKIRALAEWMFRQPLPHHIGIASKAGKLLIAPEPVIDDYSEIRRLMAVEDDSRRFFQLFILSPSYDEKNDHDFMVDRAHGLFMDGVAADRGQSTTDHPIDAISKFTFSYISERLRDKDPAFKTEVYPELAKMNFRQRNLALARWLKVNWPGCEGLEIPEMLDSGKWMNTSSLESTSKFPPARETKRPHRRFAENHRGGVILRWVWWAGVAALLALVGLVAWRLRRV